jgi:hypothetical protein
MQPTSAPSADSASVAVTLQAEDLPAFVPGLVLWLDAADADTVFADASGTAPRRRAAPWAAGPTSLGAATTPPVRVTPPCRSVPAAGCTSTAPTSSRSIPRSYPWTARRPRCSWSLRPIRPSLHRPRPSRTALAELVAVDRRLTADEEARLEGYLAWRWGIAAQLPATHPYRNAPPVR